MNVNRWEWSPIRRIAADVVIGIFLFGALSFAVTYDGAWVGSSKPLDVAMVMLGIVFSALFAFSRGFCRHLMHLHK